MNSQVPTANNNNNNNDNTDDLTRFLSFIKTAAQSGLETGKALSMRAIETVKDPNFQQSVKDGINTAVVKTKEIAVVAYGVVSTTTISAYETVKEFSDENEVASAIKKKAVETYGSARHLILNDEPTYMPVTEIITKEEGPENDRVFSDDDEVFVVERDENEVLLKKVDGAPVSEEKF